MKKTTTVFFASLLTLLGFSSVLFYSCNKDDNAQPGTFEITLYNPYGYPVILDAREFKNTNHCYLLDKHKYDCTLGAGEIRTYTGQLEDDNESGYVAIFFKDATNNSDDNDRDGIFDFYDAKAGESYCGQLINLGEITPQNTPEVFLSNGGYCDFGNNNGGGNNGGNNGGSGGCPGAEAQHYKDLMDNSPSNDCQQIWAQQAVWHAYKCNCDEGLANASDANKMVAVLNSIRKNIQDLYKSGGNPNSTKCGATPPTVSKCNVK